MNVNIKPSIEAPAFLQASSEVDFIFYALIFLLLFTLIVIFLFRRLKKTYKLIQLKRKLKTNKISMKETAYSLCRIINHNDLAAIKSLTNKDLSDIELLKYKESYSISSRVST